ncbi:MAG TPA: hypothetical protein PK357_03510 [Candidatus Pacearchaeota archaeon]|nr:hypothetical protein [Candidatus Pacearchaeota archaeon]
MPLNQLYTYTVPEEIKKIEDAEEKVIALLRNVRANVGILRPHFLKADLEFILNVVKQGKWILQDQLNINSAFLERRIGKEVRLNYDINLSDAKEIIDDYTQFSEKGCKSCINLGKLYKEMETGRYCKLDETEKSIVESPILDNKSFKIHKFYKTGCDDKSPKFRPLETVILEESIKRRDDGFSYD